jgi:hypothetical protein
LLSAGTRAKLTAEKTLLDSLVAEITDIETARSTLNNAITAAQTEKGQASVSADGKDISVTARWVTQTEMDSFSSAIDAAITARDAATATRATLEAAGTTLNSAKEVYTAAMKVGIKEANDFRTVHDAILAKSTDTVAIEDKTDVEAALTAFNSLSEAIQVQLALEKTLLDSLLVQIDVLETTAADDYKSDHMSILEKTAATITIGDKTSLMEARSAYELLSAGTRAKLTAEKNLLDSLLARIDVLETTAADDYKADHMSILEKTVETIAIDDKTALVAAQIAYTSLSDAIRAKLTAEKTLLDSLAAQITAIENAKTALSNALFEAATEKSRAIVSIDGSDVPVIKMWVTQDAIDQFDVSIAAAQQVYDAAEASETELTNAVTQLNIAVGIFRNAMQSGTRTVYVSATPGQVIVADQFNQTILLVLSAGSFIEGIGAEHITLGGDFSSISASNVTKTSSDTLSIQLSGVLARNTGVGIISIAANATTENSIITAHIAVNPIPPPATALNGLSIRVGNDGSGQELINAFDPYNRIYALQVEKETSSVKVAVTAAPDTTSKVYLGDIEVDDGVVDLEEGENTVRVIVSELNRSDRIY